MKFFLLIFVITKYVNTLILKNSIQIDESSNEIEKRAALRNESAKWNGHIFFYYVHNQLKESSISHAHSIIYNRTCLKFVKTTVKKIAHLMYAPSSMYFTVLGKRGKQPHKIFLDKKNMYSAKIAREILRALGFDYEHNRPDRDEYLYINSKKIPKDYLPLFFKQSSSVVKTYGLGYDYRSIMHFEPHENCNYKTKCIKTRKNDKLIESAMGKAKYPTFNDVKLVNLQYCLKSSEVKTSKCLHHGYPSVKVPNQCTCLPFFTGKRCEIFKPNLSICNKQNILFAAKRLNKITLKASDNCYYLIRAKKGRKIKFEVDFPKYRHLVCGCSEKENVEVRYKDISVSGSMICPQKYYNTFISQSDIVVIITKFRKTMHKITVYYKEI